MIPVVLQPEPGDFDTKVRQPGNAWLKRHGVSSEATSCRARDLQPYWRKCNRQLWEAYSGLCAYLAIYFEWVSGAASTDHFVAKSKSPGDAYEWSNYRLSCLGPNRNKGNFEDVLDPVGLKPHTFMLNLVNGKIFANPELPAKQKEAAEKTIRRLKLDNPDHRMMRARHFGQYLRHKDEKTLKELSPFVWQEAQRQSLL